MTSQASRSHGIGAMRRMTLTTIILILGQSGLGVATNLYVTIPAHHSGAHPSNYFSGSASSVAWSVSHGAVILAIHVVFGFAVALMVVATSIRLLTLGRPGVSIWALLGALMVIGAGFNGASFLDFSTNISSLLMALLAFGAVACYTIVLIQLPVRAWQ
ncbi:MAG: hypothetical protein WCA31_04285 [Acidimicrobiales bacterium]